MTDSHKNRNSLESDKRVVRAWNELEFEELRSFLGLTLSREQLLGEWPSHQSVKSSANKIATRAAGTRPVRVG